MSGAPGSGDKSFYIWRAREDERERRKALKIKSEPKPLHHQVNVVKVEEVLPHGNADSLEIIPVGGYQVVSRKGQFKVGDLAYYIPPESVLPDIPLYDFVWGSKVYEGGTPEKRRIIRAKKLRGTWSEGLLMPTLDVYQHPEVTSRGGVYTFKVGDDISDLLGIYHYNPPEPGEQPTVTKLPRPKSLRGWYHYIKSWFKGERRVKPIDLGLPSYDVTAFKKVSDAFTPGEWVRVTEKVHGSNARFVYVEKTNTMYAGSRNLWLSATSKDAWHRAMQDNPWIEEFCRANPGFALYGEIVPVQKDPKGGFYNYGVPMDNGQPRYIKFFLFDIRTPNGNWVNVHDYVNMAYADPAAFDVLVGSLVPLLYDGPFNLDTIMSLVDGETTVNGSKHIREGVVIKAMPERSIRGVGRVQFKIVSNVYLDKSGEK